MQERRRCRYAKQCREREREQSVASCGKLVEAHHSSSSTTQLSPFVPAASRSAGKPPSNDTTVRQTNRLIPVTLILYIGSKIADYAIVVCTRNHASWLCRHDLQGVPCSNLVALFQLTSYRTRIKLRCLREQNIGPCLVRYYQIRSDQMSDHPLEKVIMYQRPEKAPKKTTAQHIRSSSLFSTEPEQKRQSKQERSPHLYS